MLAVLQKIIDRLKLLTQIRSHPEAVGKLQQVIAEGWPARAQQVAQFVKVLTDQLDEAPVIFIHRMR